MGFISSLKTKAIQLLNDTGHIFKMGFIGGYGTYTAQRNIQAYVNRGYGKNPYVYMVVKKIADLTSGLPHKIVDVNGKEVSDLAFTLWNYPNANQTNEEYVNQLVTELKTTGNGYIHQPLANGKPVELRVLRSINTEPIIDVNGTILYYQHTNFSKIEKIPVTDIWHIKYNNPTGTDANTVIGLSPLQPCMQVVESSNDIFEAEGHIFKNRGVSTILTNDSDRPMLPKEKEDIQKDWDEQTGGASNYGKIRITTAKLRSIDIGLTPAQMQLSQNSIAKLRIICSAYGISPMIFGDTERSTYNNMSEAEKAMYFNVIFNVANFIYKEHNELFAKYFKTKNKIVIDKDKVDAVNTINTELSKKVIEEVKAGILTPVQGYEILYPKL